MPSSKMTWRGTLSKLLQLTGAWNKTKDKREEVVQGERKDGASKDFKF
jgi:hypothetical protein